jgi:hypothetical protein
MNVVLARRRRGFRPKISEDVLHSGMLAASASRKAEPIQAKPADEASMSDAIVGRAVVRITVSMAARKTAVQRAAMMRVVWRMVRGAAGTGS